MSYVILDEKALKPRRTAEKRYDKLISRRIQLGEITIQGQGLERRGTGTVSVRPGLYGTNLVKGSRSEPTPREILDERLRQRRKLRPRRGR